MNTTLLLPNRWKMVGWCLLIIASVTWIIVSATNYEAPALNLKVLAVFSSNTINFGNSQQASLQPLSFIRANVTNTLIGAIFIIGALMTGFSKEKREDEFIARLRLSSLLWAVWVSYLLLLLAFLLVYDMAFLTVMVYNMFTVLIFFIIRFNYLLYKNSKTPSDEK